jgi:hypothetical protein
MFRLVVAGSNRSTGNNRWYHSGRFHNVTTNICLGGDAMVMALYSTKHLNYMNSPLEQDK